MGMEQGIERARQVDLFEGGKKSFSHFDPSCSCGLRHTLSGHPLFGFDALASASASLADADIEIRLPGNRHGEGFDLVRDGLTAACAIREVASLGCWVALRGIEKLPEYDVLIGGVLDGMRRELAPWFGSLLAVETYIFISGHGRVTPLHFDPEYNILFQLFGEKRFTVLPAEERFLPQIINETYHRDGNNLLPWQAEYGQAGATYRLGPGDAVYMPYKGPHWVQVDGGGPSISLSVTWRTPASLDHDNACHFNAWLRRLGVTPRPARPLPSRPRLKALAYRGLRRMKLA